MPTTKSFEKAYEMLNAEQREAVDTIEGPVMVIAGPGTGKTQILTLRIANIIKQTDTDPHNILALTFTEAAATNMRKRLQQLIGQPALQVKITTFHAFANEVISMYPDAFPEIIGSLPITEVDRLQLIEQIILDLPLDILRPFGDTMYYARTIMSAIGTLKQEGVTPEQFSSMVEEALSRFNQINDLYYDSGAHQGKMKGKYQREAKQINKNKELAMCYAEYQQRLRDQRNYDFADMLMETVAALNRDENLRLELQETYQYILVDEHQDSNNAQNKILELLADYHEQPNLFVVGDDKQSIFRFQGASLQNFYYFRDKYTEAKLVTLTQNYRSTQSILDSAHHVLAGPVALQSNNGADERPVHIMVTPDPDAERYVVARHIGQLIEEGIEPAEIAVLYRNNGDAFAMADILGRLGISYAIESDQNIFKDPFVRRTLTILRAVAEYGRDESLAALLHVSLFGLDHLDVFKLIRSAGSRRKFRLYDLLRDKKLRRDLDLAQDDMVAELFANLEHWIKLDKNRDLITTCEAIVRESGLLSEALSAESGQNNMELLQSLFTEIQSLYQGNPDASLKDLFIYLDTAEKHNLSVLKKHHRGSRQAVRLLTMHRSKGLEFEYVFIVNAFAGHMGGRRSMNLLPLLPQVFSLSSNYEDIDDVDDADERRLFYVAITRAKQAVFISFPEVNHEGREVLPSPFIAEINDDLLEYIDVSNLVKDFQDEKPLLTREVSVQKASIINPDYLADLFTKTGLSVSALNNYLRSPWQYLYRNLLRIPQAPTKHQGYGIAVHAAIHDLFEARKRGEHKGAAFLTQQFNKHLAGEQYLSDKEFAEAQKKGEEELSQWFNHYHQSWTRETFNELRINGVYLDGEIRLTGVLDKVEFVSETEVVVVDYKTGKPKSRNDLLGETKSSTGDYYRQLVFYKLLLRYWQGGRYTMVAGEIDFVSPDGKGAFHKERFEIPDSDVDHLEQVIRDMADDISAGTFLEQPCDPDNCDYCDLYEMLVGNNSL